MNKYYFTFGLGHDNCDRYQIIIADDAYKACQKMFEMYGNQWGFQYTQAQWEKVKADGHFYRLKALEEVAAV